MTVIKVGLIGAGTMGALHARTIASSPQSRLEWIFDPNQQAAETVAQKWSSKVVSEPNFNAVDCVVISAATEVHHELGINVIQTGKPVLIEKPLGANLDESEDLVACSARQQSILVCGLLERFNPALMTALEIVTEPVALRAVRHSPYAPRIKTGVAWDLLIHDVDFCLRLFGESPETIEGLTTTLHPVSSPAAEDIAECVAKFSKNQIASLSSSRLGHTKTRSMTIIELDRAVEIDLLRQSITIYRHVDNAIQLDSLSGYRQQTVIEIPVIRHIGEPIASQWQSFLNLMNDRGDVSAERDSILPSHRVVAELLDRGKRR
jgi:predicted dehydrogenase